MVIAGLLVGTWLGVLASQIVGAGRPSGNREADVAIVLGAAAYSDQPSPVFEERIKHGIDLYRAGKVRRLLFTGGYGDGAQFAEATVAKRYALEMGVPPRAILIETESRTTRGNLVQARRLMRQNGLATAIVVSDPLHMKRALRMARDLGIEASGGPTPSSRYRSWHAKGSFLLRELYFYHHYLATGQ
ncbi:MAG: YdcF family protein [Pseudomonadota bacterium]|nr:YdcF family protein [Pseudomonadota bacterium]